MKNSTSPFDQTNESVPNLLGHYAGFISRLFAFLIDVSIISIVVVLTTWFIDISMDMFQFEPIINLLIFQVPAVAPFVEQISSPATAGIVIFIFTVLYYVLFWYFFGKTVGKALMGLRVAPLKGGRIPLWRAFVRYFSYYVSGACLLIGFLWIIIDDRRMGWHDKFARTCVIYTWDAKPDETFLKYATNVLQSRREALRRLRSQEKRLKDILESPDDKNLSE